MAVAQEFNGDIVVNGVIGGAEGSNLATKQGLSVHGTITGEFLNTLGSSTNEAMSQYAVTEYRSAVIGADGEIQQTFDSRAPQMQMTVGGLADNLTNNRVNGLGVYKVNSSNSVGHLIRITNFIDDQQSLYDFEIKGCGSNKKLIYIRFKFQKTSGNQGITYGYAESYSADIGEITYFNAFKYNGVLCIWFPALVGLGNPSNLNFSFGRTINNDEIKFTHEEVAMPTTGVTLLVKVDINRSVYLNEFDRNINESGYVKLPNGIIIQWMQVQKSGNRPWPLVYPNTCLTAIINPALSLQSDPAYIGHAAIATFDKGGCNIATMGYTYVGEMGITTMQAAMGNGVTGVADYGAKSRVISIGY